MEPHHISCVQTFILVIFNLTGNLFFPRNVHFGKYFRLIDPYQEIICWLPAPGHYKDKSVDTGPGRGILCHTYNLPLANCFSLWLYCSHFTNSRRGLQRTQTARDESGYTFIILKVTLLDVYLVMCFKSSQSGLLCFETEHLFWMEYKYNGI